MRTFGMGLMVHLGQVKRPTRIYHTQVFTESFSSNFVLLGYPQRIENRYVLVHLVIMIGKLKFEERSQNPNDRQC